MPRNLLFLGWLQALYELAKRLREAINMFVTFGLFGQFSSLSLLQISLDFRPQVRKPLVKLLVGPSGTSFMVVHVDMTGVSTRAFQPEHGAQQVVPNCNHIWRAFNQLGCIRNVVVPASRRESVETIDTGVRAARCRFLEVTICTSDYTPVMNQELSIISRKSQREMILKFAN